MEYGANTSGLLSYQRNHAAIMMQYKNMKVNVCSLDGDIDFFEIIVGVLQGDTLPPYLFIIYLDYVLQTLIDLIKENGFTLEKARSKRHPTQTITYTNYTDDIPLLINTARSNPGCKFRKG